MWSVASMSTFSPSGFRFNPRIGLDDTLAFFVQSLGEFFVVIEKAYCNNMRWYTEAIYSSTFCNRGDPHARPLKWTAEVDLQRCEIVPTRGGSDRDIGMSMLVAMVLVVVVACLWYATGGRPPTVARHCPRRECVSLVPEARMCLFDRLLH